MSEWIQSDGAACYNSVDPGFALGQNGVLTYGQIVVINFTISSMTQGKLILDSLEGKPEYTEDGDYAVIGIASSENLTFIGDEVSGDVFDGCISDVGARVIPLYSIKDLNGNVVFRQVDETGVTTSGNNIQYQVDWTGIAEGCYVIYFTDGIIDYQSDPLYVKTDHECSIQLTWSNDEDAYAFDYANLNFAPSLRVSGKLWMPKWAKDKEVFKDSIGNRTILRSDTSKIEILTINEAPEYIHSAIAVGMEHDTFEIDAIQYVVEDSEYDPKWRKSSHLAPSEINVIKKNQNLVNENCA